MPSTARANELMIPGHWGNLPGSGKWEDEVEWVHANRGRCIKRTQAGNATIDLFKAIEPAPSEGALGIMVMAADDPKMFNQLLLAVKKSASDDEEEGQCKRSIRRTVEEINRLIEEFK